MKKKISYRIEEDSLGKVKVPKDALYGAQTQRAVDNFQIGNDWFYPSFIQSLAMLKGACAIANYKSNIINKKLSSAIHECASQINNNIADYYEHFPAPLYQTGSGTSINMNMNEVLANLVSKKLKQKVHPNDDINKSQSSNDVIPTTINISCVRAEAELVDSMGYLDYVLEKKSNDLKKIVKSGRTHLMDAVPISFGQEIEIWRQLLQAAYSTMDTARDEILSIPIGGTAIGTGLNAPKGFDKKVCIELNKIYKNLKIKFRPLSEKGQMISSQDHILTMSASLVRISSSITKICNDLRWMNSGPTSGLAEITLKPLQPGSSIMPGKINPVMPEAILMAMTRVLGNNNSITSACMSSNFQLNTMLPIIAHNIIESFEIVTDSCLSLASTIQGFKANEENIRKSLERNPIVATKLNEVVGYDLAAKIVKEAYKTNKSIIDIAEQMTNLSRSQLVKLLDPKKLI